MSDAEDYDRLMTVFEELREAGGPERKRRLNQLRGEASASWVGMLEELLEVDSEVDSPLERGAPLTPLSDGGLSLLVRAAGSGTASAEASGGERPLPAAIGEVIGAYRLTGVIGRGGMGCVYRGVHEELGRLAAIKVLEPLLTRDDEYLSRFLHEARIVNAAHHPNVVDVFDFVEVEEPRRVALVMELLEGKPLGQLLAERPLTLDEMVGATLQLSGALEAVHALGVVHRDLKPDNMMVIGPLDTVDQGPSLKLLDFGIAKISDPLALHRTASGTVLGTPTYMAPEQFGSDGVTAASDVYALAELIYEMLTQRPLFEERGLAMIRRKMSGEPQSLALPPSLPQADALRDLLQDCLQVVPDRRPTVREVGRRLALIYPELARRWKPPSLKSRPVKSPKKAGTPVRRLAFSGMVLAALLGGVWLAVREGSNDARGGLSVGSEIERSERSDALFPAADPTSAHPTDIVPLPAVVYAEGEETLYSLERTMGNFEALEIDPRWTENPRSGRYCLRVRYRAATGWAGASWMDPPYDWGDLSGGHAFPGAERLVFWARGAKGGEHIEFGYGLILKTRPFYDTARDGVEVDLSTEWQRFEIDLEGQSLERIKVGFYLVIGIADPEIYLDDISFE